MPEWFSIYWFEWHSLRSFQWESPIFLYGIPVLLLFFWLRSLLHNQSKQRLHIATLGRNLQINWVQYLRYIPPTLMFLCLALLLIALARPQRLLKERQILSEGVDLMLAIDISDSMKEIDILPNRLDAAKRVAAEFIKNRIQDRIGLVVFAGEAFSLCPLTNDYDALLDFIQEIGKTSITMPGTAIGNALGVCVNRLRESKTKSKVVILLSDGENTAGNLDPATAAQLAYAYRIRVYSIAIGTNTENGKAIVNETALRQVANTSQGQFFRATNANALREIFRQINLLEKSEIETTEFRNVQDVFQTYIRWAIVFLLLFMVTKLTFISNILED